MCLLIRLRSRLTNDLQRVDWPRTVLLVLLVFAVFAALWQHFMPEVKEITTTAFKRVPQIQKVAEVKRIYVPVKQVVTLDKHEVAQKLDMPWLEGGNIAEAKAEESASAAPALGQETRPAETAPVTGNPADLQITGTADLPKTENGLQVVSVLNTETGITTLISKEKPAPWFEFDNALIAGIRYGLNHRLEQTGTVYGSWEFLRVKNFHLLGYGEINTNAEGKIQADLQYRR